MICLYCISCLCTASTSQKTKDSSRDSFLMLVAEKVNDATLNDGLPNISGGEDGEGSTGNDQGSGTGGTTGTDSGGGGPAGVIVGVVEVSLYDSRDVLGELRRQGITGMGGGGGRGASGWRWRKGGGSWGRRKGTTTASQWDGWMKSSSTMQERAGLYGV